MVSARSLLADLRGRGVVFETDGEELRADAPAGVVTEELRAAVEESKWDIVKLLVWERRKLEEADRRGLVIKYAREPGWIALHDPTTGEWHEVRESECLPSVVEVAKTNARRKKAAR